MAENSTANGKNPTLSPGAASQWSDFLTEIEGVLDELNTQKTAAMDQDSKDLGAFIKSESNLYSKAVEFGGPLPYHTSPNWDLILSDTKGKFGLFGNIIKDTLAHNSLEEDEKRIHDDNIMSVIREAFRTSWEALGKPVDGKPTVGPPKTEEEFVEWIGSTIINLEKELDPEFQVRLFKALTDKVFAVKDAGLAKKPWNQFDPKSKNTVGGAPTETAAPGKAPDEDTQEQVDEFYDYTSNSTGIWPGQGKTDSNSFLFVVARLFADKDDTDAQREKDTASILHLLEKSRTQYDGTRESSVRNWIQTTLSNLPTTLKDRIKESSIETLISNLQDAITDLFPQPDKAYFFNHFQTYLYRNIYDEPDVAARDLKTLNAASGREGSKANPFEINGVKDLITKYIDENYFSKEGSRPKKAPTINRQNLGDLLTQVANAIHRGIRKTFTDLINQGSQGDLILATYERETVTRIVDYTATLLNEMSVDLDKDIPENQAFSLSAAKDVTAAAVAMRQYVVSLGEVVSQFEGAGGNRQKSNNQANSNYENIRAIVGPTPDMGLGAATELLYLNDDPDNEPKVKSAEFEGVQLAAISAGLGVSLQSIILDGGAQKEALTALNKLKAAAKGDYEKKYSLYQTDSDAYFTSLDSFIKDKQEFEFDQFNRQVIQEAMDKITDMVVELND